MFQLLIHHQPSTVPLPRSIRVRISPPNRCTYCNSLPPLYYIYNALYWFGLESVAGSWLGNVEQILASAQNINDGTRSVVRYVNGAYSYINVSQFLHSSLSL